MQKPSPHSVAILKAIFAVIFWGASFIATKMALREISPITLIWLRFGIGVVVLALYVFIGKHYERVAVKELPGFILLGFLGIAFHQWLQANGLVTARATTTSWIITTIPVFTAILGRTVLKERLGAVRVGGIAVAALGVVVVVGHGDITSILRGSFGTFGDVLILISALNWAVFSILSRRILSSHHPTNMMLHVMVIGWVLTSILYVTEIHFDFQESFSTHSTQTWIAICFLGIFCSGFAFIFWYDALKVMPASRVGVLLYIEPLVTVVIAAFLIDEPITIATMIGGALILGGVWLVNRSE